MKSSESGKPRVSFNGGSSSAQLFADQVRANLDSVKDREDGDASAMSDRLKSRKRSLVRATSMPSSRRGSEVFGSLSEMAQPSKLAQAAHAIMAGRLAQDVQESDAADEKTVGFRESVFASSARSSTLSKKFDDEDDSSPVVKMDVMATYSGASGHGVNGDAPDDHYEILDSWVTPIRKSRRSLGDAILGRAATQGKLFDVDSENDEEEAKAAKPGMAFMIFPASPQHLSWDILGLLFVFWDCLWIPFLWFSPRDHWVTGTIVWSARIYWTMALAVAFRIGFLNEQGEAEMRPMKVAKRYIKTWFWLDLFLVWIDWLDVVSKMVSENDQGEGEDGVVNSRLSALRAFRVLRTIRLVRLIKAPIFFRYLTELVRSEEVFLFATICKIMLSMFILVHFLACSWYGIGSSDLYTDSWVKAEDVYRESLALRYTVSFHWSLSTFAGETLFAATNLLERIYTCFVLFIAFMIAASLVSSITTAMTRLENNLRQITSQTMQLRRFLGDTGISSKLSVRIQRNARHVLLEQKRNIPESAVELLKVISEPLMVEMHYEVRSGPLVHHPFFECFDETNPAGIRKVCHCAVRQLMVSLGDVLFSDGEAPTNPAMYFLVGGSVRYKQEGGDQPLDLVCNIGQWFAEGVLWTHWHHHGTLRVESEHSRLIVIDAKEFQEICQPFGMIQIQRYAEQFVESLNYSDKTAHNDLGFLMDDILDMICSAFPELVYHSDTSSSDDDYDDNEDMGGSQNSDGENEIRIVSTATTDSSAFANGGQSTNSEIFNGGNPQNTKHLSVCAHSSGMPIGLRLSNPSNFGGKNSVSADRVSRLSEMRTSWRQSIKASITSTTWIQKISSVFKGKKKDNRHQARPSKRGSMVKVQPGQGTRTLDTRHTGRGHTKPIGFKLKKRCAVVRKIVFFPCTLLLRCLYWLFPGFKPKGKRNRRMSNEHVGSASTRRTSRHSTGSQAGLTHNLAPDLDLDALDLGKKNSMRSNASCSSNRSNNREVIQGISSRRKSSRLSVEPSDMPFKPGSQRLSNQSIDSTMVGCTSQDCDSYGSDRNDSKESSSREQSGSKVSFGGSGDS
jgi:hypothetical protein